MNEIKAPIYLRTWTLFKRLGDLVTFGMVASICGKEVQTVEAWGREPASVMNPDGTGRKNPADCILRLIGKAHAEGDRTLAREIAETFVTYVDWLDGVEVEIADLDELIGASLKEHSEAAIEALNIRSKPNYSKAMTEIVQAEIALRDLKSYVQKQMLPLRSFAAEAVNGRGVRNGGKA